MHLLDRFFLHTDRCTNKESLHSYHGSLIVHRDPIGLWRNHKHLQKRYSEVTRFGRYRSIKRDDDMECSSNSRSDYMLILDCIRPWEESDLTKPSYADGRISITITREALVWFNLSYKEHAAEITQSDSENRSHSHAYLHWIMMLPNI